MRDTIVEEVRKARDEYARRFKYDLHAMCADLRREQDLSDAEIVSLPKRPCVNRPAQQGAQADNDSPNEAPLVTDEEHCRL